VTGPDREKAACRDLWSEVVPRCPDYASTSHSSFWSQRPPALLRASTMLFDRLLCTSVQICESGSRSLRMLHARLSDFLLENSTLSESPSPPARQGSKCNRVFVAPSGCCFRPSWASLMHCAFDCQNQKIVVAVVEAQQLLR
jgi:hypothetical protein